MTAATTANLHLRIRTPSASGKWSDCQFRGQLIHSSKALQQRAHLHATAQAQHQVQRRLLLDVVIGKRAAVLQLLAGEDEALLVRRYPCLKVAHTRKSEQTSGLGSAMPKVK